MGDKKIKNLEGQTRREFLKRSAVLAGAAAGGTLLRRTANAGTRSSVALVRDADDVLTQSGPVQWATDQLSEALQARGLSVVRCRSVAEAGASDVCIYIARANSKGARQGFERAGVALPNGPEVLGLQRARIDGRQVLVACGSDERGLIYAVLELADRVGLTPEPMGELRRMAAVVQKPANQIRSIARLFASEVEDKEWFNDRSFWEQYLTELARHRFNRFSLTLGLGYDFPTDIRDAYFHFAYPFLIEVPGYQVRAEPLPDDERERNLVMLRFIGEETVRRGLHFQLGLWTHAYQWVDSPKANYLIKGLSGANHAQYCRDALTALLKACPTISGITFRIHGESGIAEGSYEFWETVFAGVGRCGRRVEIDMHAKGIDEKMIELGMATGMPVNVSPKFWAEHMGLGYMQGAIRPLEMPPRGETDKGFFSRSSGSRRFLRYGYGDLLKEKRDYGVLHRIWPGTQRLLLWGDPQLAADYGRAASFCGSVGVELCEPLSFKGARDRGCREAGMVMLRRPCGRGMIFKNIFTSTGCGAAAFTIRTARSMNRAAGCVMNLAEPLNRWKQRWRKEAGFCR